MLPGVLDLLNFTIGVMGLKNRNSRYNPMDPDQVPVGKPGQWLMEAVDKARAARQQAEDGEAMDGS